MSGPHGPFGPPRPTSRCICGALPDFGTSGVQLLSGSTSGNVRAIRPTRDRVVFAPFLSRPFFWRTSNEEAVCFLTPVPGRFVLAPTLSQRGGRAPSFFLGPGLGVQPSPSLTRVYMVVCMLSLTLCSPDGRAGTVSRGLQVANPARTPRCLASLSASLLPVAYPWLVCFLRPGGQKERSKLP